MESTTRKPIEWHNIRLVPILHNRMEFALEVRRQFEAFRPDCVAVEYPDTLADRILQGIKRLPLLSVVCYEEKDGAFTYLVLEPTDAQVEAVRLALAESVPVHFIDRDTEGYLRDLSPMPDPYAVTRIGLSRYYKAYLDVYGPDPSSREDVLREKTMAYHLQRLSSEKKRVLFVGGMAHFPGLLRLLDRPQTSVIGRRKREGVGLAHLHMDSSREIMTEMPFLAAAFERVRAGQGIEDPDRLKINRDLIKIAGENLYKNSKEDLSPGDLKVFNKFAGNYALLTGDLVPNFYQLLVAARGAKDDNFAYEVWEKGSEYPWQSESPGLPVLRLTGEDIFLDQKRIRFHRRLKTMRRRLISVPVKKRMREKYPGEWKRDFKGYSICSYPPEDVVIEGYGRNLRKRAIEIKTEENARVEPFACSMLDGIDIRETIRDWTSGKIYVKAERPFRGKVGSLVVIFDPDVTDNDGKENFPWCVTWLGEHDQESDMAFYSTPAGEVMDGPGISRCQYGGFMLTFPPMRVYDIWKDPVFNIAGNKPERLLMAAIDYSLERHVLYVSATPPSGWCQNMAARLGKKIIYLPIGIFSPVTLKKIREVHILDGHHVRQYARHFI